MRLVGEDDGNRIHELTLKKESDGIHKKGKTTKVFLLACGEWTFCGSAEVYSDENWKPFDYGGKEEVYFEGPIYGIVCEELKRPRYIDPGKKEGRLKPGVDDFQYKFEQELRLKVFCYEIIPSKDGDEAQIRKTERMTMLVKATIITDGCNMTNVLSMDYKPDFAIQSELKDAFAAAHHRVYFKENLIIRFTE